MEIDKDRWDYLYSLAGKKGETIDTLKTKTVNELHRFAERVIEDGRH